MASDHRYSLFLGPFAAQCMAFSIVVGAAAGWFGEWRGDGLLMTLSLVGLSGFVLYKCWLIASHNSVPRHKVISDLGLLVACFLAIAPVTLNFPPGLGLFTSLFSVALGFYIGQRSTTELVGAAANKQPTDAAVDERMKASRT